jgi:tRNA threonylcarbamoyladenosine biosynthesis protein TsaE
MTLEDMQCWAARFAHFLSQEVGRDSRPILLRLQGTLGAGKTTFARAFIQALVPDARVKSPTYTYVESYHNEAFALHHFDLYRLSSGEELEDMGIRDYFDQPGVLLVEWYEKAQGVLPPPQWTLTFEYAGMDARCLTLTPGAQV